MSRTLPVSPNLEHLKNEAKTLLRAQQKKDPSACGVFRRLHQFAQAADQEILQAEIGLQEAQYALAMDYGFDSWARLKHHVESLAGKPTLRRDKGKAWVEPLSSLGWGGGKDCTFLGALEAALRVTDEPYSYEDLMGLSGMALRVRMHKDFCPSAGVGEMPDEHRAIARTTGWHIQTDCQLGQKIWDHPAVARKIVASIDDGKPVLAYNDRLDVCVVYGYEQGGQVLWHLDYDRPDEIPCRVPVDKIGPQQSYLGRKDPALPAAEQLKDALQTAVAHWRRGSSEAVPGQTYHYGPSAYNLWIDTLRRADTMSPEQLKGLIHGHGCVFFWLIDAKQAAATFLRERCGLLDGKARDHMRRASEACSTLSRQLHQAYHEEHLFRNPGPNLVSTKWTADLRRREIDVLENTLQQDTVIIRQLETVLAAVV